MLDLRARMYARRSEAGLGAKEAYRERRKAWRKRVFRHPWLILFAFYILLVAVVVVERRSFGHFLLDFLLGSVVTIFITLIDSPPDRITNWQRGYEGELKTARVLAPLAEGGCVILHDYPDHRRSGHEDKGNIDHVVISPAGVFLLDSKNLGGAISVDQGQVGLKMLEDDFVSPEGRLVRKALGCAFRLYQDVAKQQVPIGFVQAVIVFWNDFEQGLVDEREGCRVVFVHGERLADWLGQEIEGGTRPPGWVAEVADGIRAARPPERQRSWRARLLP
jgi:hypothetical protein